MSNPTAQPPAHAIPELEEPQFLAPVIPLNPRVYASPERPAPWGTTSCTNDQCPCEKRTAV